MFRIINKLKNRKGFTLIELIVVLAVLAVIMAIAIPRFLGVQQTAKLNSDDATIGLIAKAAELYYAQNPTATDVNSADDLVAKDYIDKISFKTSRYGATSGSAIDITHSSGEITMKYSTHEVYPNNTLDVE